MTSDYNTSFCQSIVSGDEQGPHPTLLCSALQGGAMHAGRLGISSTGASALKASLPLSPLSPPSSGQTPPGFGWMTCPDPAHGPDLLPDPPLHVEQVGSAYNLLTDLEELGEIGGTYQSWA